MPATAAPTAVLGPTDGRAVQIGALGARFMVDAATAGGGFSLVEHPLGPRALGAPMHTHQNEDEYSYVLEGRVGVQVGDEVVVAGPGELVIKPRGIAHAFWNPTDEHARLLEIISPGGFEKYFEELAPLMPPQVAAPDIPAMVALQARYGVTSDFESIGRLAAEHGLDVPGV